MSARRLPRLSHSLNLKKCLAAIIAYERLLGEHGFAVSLRRIADPDCGEHTVWLAYRQAAADAAG